MACSATEDRLEIISKFPNEFLSMISFILDVTTNYKMVPYKSQPKYLKCIKKSCCDL